MIITGEKINVVENFIMIMNIGITVTRVFIIVISTFDKIHPYVNEFPLCRFIDVCSNKCEVPKNVNVRLSKFSLLHDYYVLNSTHFIIFVRLFSWLMSFIGSIFEANFSKALINYAHYVMLACGSMRD